MSVYTRVSWQDLSAFLDDYEVGALLDFKGITEGIDNTNYFVDTVGGRYVLTLFERYDEEELEFFLGLLGLLADAGLPCAHPLACAGGRYLRRLNGKPAALVERLPGHAVTVPSAAQCAAVGAALGSIHVVARDYPGRHADKFGRDWFHWAAAAVLPRLGAGERALLTEALHANLPLLDAGLPSGVIHADLFRDNALFEGERLTGVIDFYTACNGQLLYDVAICVNDWCTMADGGLDAERGGAFLGAYRQVRLLTEEERDRWPEMLRLAALRFWLSRLYDRHFPRSGDLTHLKDPDQFRTILERRRAEPEAALRLWTQSAAAVREAP